MLATRFPTCVETGVVSTKYRGVVAAALRCRGRNMDCDPSDAGAYMCLADIAAGGRVPCLHASRLWLDRPGLELTRLGLGAETGRTARL